MRLRPFGQTPLINVRRIIALRGRRPAAVSLELTCYGKPDCSLCDKAKVPIERTVRLSNGRIVADWVDILSDDALVVRWGERIPVVCAGETVLAEGKISEVWLGRAIEKYLRERESGN